MMKLAVFTSVVLAQATFLHAQQPDDVNEGSRIIHSGPSLYQLSWWGRSGKQYLIQQSDDLVNWSYFPIGIFGQNGIASLNLQTNALSGYFRLEIADFASIGFSPNANDFDGDGIPNWLEVAMGTNPFVADTDGDGVPDNVDPFPLDPTISGGPLLSVPGAPVITLIYPPGAVPQ